MSLNQLLNSVYPNAWSNLKVNGIALTSSFQLVAGASGGRVLTSDGSGFGTWQPASPGTVFTDHASAHVSFGAAALNFGGTTVNVPYDTLDFGSNWSIVSGGTSSAVLQYTGAGGRFAVTATCAYQHNSAGAQDTTMSFSLGGGGVGGSTSTQAETAGDISSITQSLIFSAVNGQAFAVLMSAAGISTDFTIQPSIGCASINIVQIG